MKKAKAMFSQEKILTYDSETVYLVSWPHCTGRIVANEDAEGEVS